MGNPEMQVYSTEQILNLDLDWYDRLSLVKRATTTKYFQEALRITPEAEIRTAIVSRITDHDVIEQVLREDNDASVRFHAINKLPADRIEILKHLIENDPDHTIRAKAVEILPEGYQLVFLHVLINDDHMMVRRKATKKLRLNLLKDLELAELCIKCQEPLVRKGAVYQLKDQKLLTEVAIKAEDYKIIDLAIQKIDDEFLLKRVAEEAEFAHGRYGAIYKLTDQNFIADRCIQEDNIEVMKSCIEQIDDIEILARLRLQANEAIQPAIKNKISKLDY